MQAIIEKLTQKSMEAFQAALLEAQKNQYPQIEPVLLIQALLKIPDNLALSVLEALNTPLPALTKDIEAEVQKLPKVSGDSSPPYPSKDFISLITKAEKWAGKQGDDYISTEHFILAVFSILIKNSV